MDLRAFLQLVQLFFGRLVRRWYSFSRAGLFFASARGCLFGVSFKPMAHRYSCSHLWYRCHRSARGRLDWSDIRWCTESRLARPLPDLQTVGIQIAVVCISALWLFLPRLKPKPADSIQTLR